VLFSAEITVLLTKELFSSEIASAVFVRNYCITDERGQHRLEKDAENKFTAAERAALKLYHGAVEDSEEDIRPRRQP